MPTYTINCEWDPTGWWVITIPDVPGAITQTRRLDQVDRNVAEIIKLMTGKKAGTYRTDLHWAVPGPAGQAAEEACRQRIALEQTQQEAAKASKDAISRLRGAGLSYRDIGTMIGVSYQRAQQIATVS